MVTDTAGKDINHVPVQFAFEESETGVQLGSAKATTHDDDEFSYAFQGEQRLGPVHKQEFKAQPMPAGMLSDVRSQPLSAVGEQEEEEEEDDDDNQCSDEATDAGNPQPDLTLAHPHLTTQGHQHVTSGEPEHGCKPVNGVSSAFLTSQVTSQGPPIERASSSPAVDVSMFDDLSVGQPIITVIPTAQFEGCPRHADSPENVEIEVGNPAAVGIDMQGLVIENVSQEDLLAVQDALTSIVQDPLQDADVSLNASMESSESIPVVVGCDPATATSPPQTGSVDELMHALYGTLPSNGLVKVYNMQTSLDDMDAGLPAVDVLKPEVAAFVSEKALSSVLSTATSLNYVEGGSNRTRPSLGSAIFQAGVAGVPSSQNDLGVNRRSSRQLLGHTLTGAAATVQASTGPGKVGQTLATTIQVLQQQISAAPECGTAQPATPHGPAGSRSNRILDLNQLQATPPGVSTVTGALKAAVQNHAAGSPADGQRPASLQSSVKMTHSSDSHAHMIQELPSLALLRAISKEARPTDQRGIQSFSATEVPANMCSALSASGDMRGVRKAGLHPGSAPAAYLTGRPGGVLLPPVFPAPQAPVCSTSSSGHVSSASNAVTAAAAPATAGSQASTAAASPYLALQNFVAVAGAAKLPDIPSPAQNGQLNAGGQYVLGSVGRVEGLGRAALAPGVQQPASASVILDAPSPEVAVQAKLAAEAGLAALQKLRSASARLRDGGTTSQPTTGPASMQDTAGGGGKVSEQISLPLSGKPFTASNTTAQSAYICQLADRAKSLINPGPSQNSVGAAAIQAITPASAKNVDGATVYTLDNNNLYLDTSSRGVSQPPSLGVDASVAHSLLKSAALTQPPSQSNVAQLSLYTTSDKSAKLPAVQAPASVHDVGQPQGNAFAATAPASVQSTSSGVSLKASSAVPSVQLAAPPPAQAMVVTSSAAEDEWDAANRQRQQEEEAARAAAAGNATAHPGQAPIMLYSEACKVAGSMASDAAMQEARQLMSSAPSPAASSKPGLFARLFACGAPALPSLSKDAADEKALIVALARTTYSDTEPQHWRLLRGSYAAMTGRTSAPERYGSHWGVVGWQGSDPATDLRGAGILGLLQMVSLADKHKALCSALYQLSQPGQPQEFPLAVVSLNVTRHTLTALRAGKLDAAIRREGSAWPVISLFHAGAMATFYNVWKTHNKTMKDSGYVMKDLETLCAAQPDKILAAAVKPLAQ